MSKPSEINSFGELLQLVTGQPNTFDRQQQDRRKKRKELDIAVLARMAVGAARRKAGSDERVFLETLNWLADQTIQVQPDWSEEDRLCFRQLLGLPT